MQKNIKSVVMLLLVLFTNTKSPVLNPVIEEIQDALLHSVEHSFNSNTFDRRNHEFIRLSNIIVMPRYAVLRSALSRSVEHSLDQEFIYISSGISIKMPEKSSYCEEKSEVKWYPFVFHGLSPLSRKTFVCNDKRMPTASELAKRFDIHPDDISLLSSHKFREYFVVFTGYNKCQYEHLENRDDITIRRHEVEFSIHNDLIQDAEITDRMDLESMIRLFQSISTRNPSYIVFLTMPGETDTFCKNYNQISAYTETDRTITLFQLGGSSFDLRTYFEREGAQFHEGVLGYDRAYPVTNDLIRMFLTKLHTHISPNSDYYRRIVGLGFAHILIPNEISDFDRRGAIAPVDSYNAGVSLLQIKHDFKENLRESFHSDVIRFASAYKAKNGVSKALANLLYLGKIEIESIEDLRRVLIPSHPVINSLVSRHLICDSDLERFIAKLKLIVNPQNAWHSFQ